MKKTLILTIFLVFVSVILIACGESNKSNTEESKKGNGETPGVTSDKIKIGIHGPLSGEVSVYGNNLRGLDTYFKYVNERGGINGRKVEVVMYDDQYQPAKTVEAAKRLVETDKVFAIVGPPCTPCFAAASRVYEDSDTPVLGMAPASKFVNPPYPNRFATLMSFGLEAKIIADYAVNKLEGKKIAVFYQNDDFGKDGMSAAVEHLKQFNDVEIVEVPYTVNDVDFTAQSLKIKEENPDVVLAFAVPKPAASLKKEMKKLNVDVPYLVSYTVGNTEIPMKLAGYETWEGTVSTDHRLGLESDDPKIQLFKEQFKKYYPNEQDGAAVALNGWHYGLIFEELVKRMGDDITHENFIKQIKSLDKWQGSLAFRLSYGEENHYGVTSLVFNRATKDGDVEIISELVEINPATYEVTYE